MTSSNPMSILGIQIKKEFTLGQLVFAMVFVLGIAMSYGSMKSRITANEVDLASYMASQSQINKDVSRDFVRKTELDPELKSIRTELETIKTIAFSYVTGRQMSSEDIKRITEDIIRAERGRKSN